MFFVILVTHPKSYRRRIAAISAEVRTGAIVKNSEFCNVGGAKSKTAFFRIFRVPSTILHTAYMKQFYPKPMVAMES